MHGVYVWCVQLVRVGNTVIDNTVPRWVCSTMTFEVG